MKRHYILEEWNRFAEEVFGPEHPEIQRDEMRRAFYIGAAAMFFLLIRNISTGPELEVNPSDIDMMTSIQAEIDAFRKKEEEGREGMIQ